MKPRSEGDWVKVASLGEVRRSGRKVIKLGAKQIALFHGEKGLYACNNRCPHEGYPLMEGSLAEGCVLTCNWHNWKFDLESGETLVGGDKLRRYPVALEGDEVWLDVADPPADEQAAAALENLRDSFRQHEYDRMGREISRLQKSGADPLDAVRAAIVWTHDRMEFGMTHAHAAAPDWLTLRAARRNGDEALRLVPLMEIVGHLAWDSLREPAYPFPAGAASFDPVRLVAAIEAEDEPAAAAQVRGALAEGLGFAELEAPLAEAALAHYADFGHSAIYVLKTGQLIEHLGPEVAEPLLLALVRSLVYASREDLIPEFRDYRLAVEAWDDEGSEPARAEDFRQLGVRQALRRTLESSGDIPGLYDALLDASAWQMLHFDLPRQGRTDIPVSQNVGWLDFTHMLTFGNAARTLCQRHPKLWPQALLQMACFLGRNAGHVDADLPVGEWRVPDAERFFRKTFEAVLDHSQFEYIVSSHLIKVATAVRDEVAAAPQAPWAPTILAATNRFLHSPLKRKHTLRTARQALSFVAAEG